MIYYSKRDWWLGVLMLGVTGYSTALTMFESGLSFLGIFMAIVFAFICWIWFGTYYRIIDGILVARCGPFKMEVEIDRIRAIKDTHNPLSSPSLSLDRIEITGDKVYLIISPKDKAKFINHLKEINSSIVYKNDI